MSIVFAVGNSLGYFLIFPNQKIKTEKRLQQTDSNDLTTKITIITTTPHDIPKAQFVMPRLAILILLAPMLKKAKIGPMEL